LDTHEQVNGVPQFDCHHIAEEAPEGLAAALPEYLER
jgi:hypothetical protein